MRGWDVEGATALVVAISGLVAGLAGLVAAVMALIRTIRVGKAVEEVHRAVNSRVDELVNTTRADALQQGASAERAAIATGEAPPVVVLPPPKE